MSGALLVVVLAGCLQPVGEANGQVITSCRGDCPYGECDDWCASHADAGCDSPEDCLRRSACRTLSSCAAYTADRFGLEAGRASACAATPGSYCAAAAGADGLKVTLAVGCSDAGVESVLCSAIDTCDGGVLPAICRAACGPQYCVR